MRAVARGRTLKILYFDPSRLSDTLDQLRSVLTPTFIGRLEGEATCDEKRTRFMILVNRGCICAAGLERDGEVIKGHSALAGIATCLSRGSGIIEIAELDEVGLKLDMEFNPEIAMSESVNVEEFLNHIKMKVSEATRVVEEMGRESLEPKPVEAPSSPQAPLAPEAKASTPLEALDKVIAELEARVPSEEEGVEKIPEVDVRSLGVPLSPVIEEVSDAIAREIHIVAPKVIISAVPVFRGKVRASEVLANTSKLSEEGNYIAIVRLNHRAYYILLTNGTVCAAIELNEVKLKAIDKGEAALKKLVASSDVAVEFTLWKLDKGIGVLDEALSKCLESSIKAIEKAKEARETKTPEAAKEERKRGFLSKLFRWK